MTKVQQERPYVPQPYRTSNTAARQIIRSYPFASIVTSGCGVIEATQTPLFFESDAPDCTTLIGHIAKANPQSVDLMTAGTPILAVFNGPSAYVSPNWYVEDEDVPTWVYQSVHVRGVIEPLALMDMRKLMEKIIDLSERRIGGVWNLSRIAEADIARMMPRIIGFHIHITALNGIEKLEQMRSPINRQSVAEALGSGNEMGRAPLVKLLS